MKIFAEAEKLILREIIPADAGGFFELDSDPEVHRYLGNNRVKNGDQAMEVIESIRKQYEENGIRRCVIIDRITNDFISWTG
jgi:RimJ/RimL family protein N-acetyltransferase